MSVRPRLRLADFCEICGQLLVTRAVRRRGHCTAHPRQGEFNTAEPVPFVQPGQDKCEGRWPR